VFVCVYDVSVKSFFLGPLASDGFPRMLRGV
jgi:hypothetical protein